MDLRAVLVSGVLAVACLGGAIAHARSNKPDPMMGHWEFSTARLDSGCTMTGLVTVTRRLAPNRFACTMVAHETCPDVRIRADQTCVVERSSDGVRITATIVRVTPDVGYAPDDFELQEDEPGRRMTGRLVSASVAEAEFRRPQSVPTS